MDQSQDLKTQLQIIVEGLDPQFRSQGEKDINALLAAGVGSFDDLLAIVQDVEAETELRAVSAWVLARLGDERAVAPLLATLKDRRADLRATAARALGELGGAIPVTDLVNALLGDDDGEVRVASAYALGLLGDQDAVDPLIAVLNNAQELPRVRGMVAEALADLRDDRAVDPLIAALSDPSVQVRFWATFALGELGAARALPRLQQLAASDEGELPGRGTVREEASAAIRRIQDQQTDTSNL